MNTSPSNNISNVFVHGTWRHPPCPTCRKPHSPAWSCWDICNSCFERHPWGQCPTIAIYQLAPRVAMSPPTPLVGFPQVQPVQMTQPQFGLHQAPPDQETQHVQQLFQQFLAEQSPQLFQQFLQWREMQPAQQQPIMPAPVQQPYLAQQQPMILLPQHQLPLNVGATVSYQPPSPQMPHQGPLPTREGTPMILRVTPTRRTSVTPRRLTWSAQSKASSGALKKEDRSSLAPIFDTANMVSKKKKRRRRRCKYPHADRTESEAVDQSEAKEVEIKQEVKQANRSAISAAFNGEQSDAKRVRVKREAMQENVAGDHTAINMNQSDVDKISVKKVKQEERSAIRTACKVEPSEGERVKVKQEGQNLHFWSPIHFITRPQPKVTPEVKYEVKQEDQTAPSPEHSTEQFKAEEWKVKKEVKQELRASTLAGSKPDRSEAEMPKVKREIKLEKQAAVPAASHIKDSTRGEFRLKQDFKIEAKLDKSETRRYLGLVSSNANQGVKVKAETEEGEEKAEHDVFARERASKAFHERVVTEVVGPEFVTVGPIMHSHPGSALARNSQDNRRDEAARYKWNVRCNEDNHLDIKVDWSDDDEDFKMKYEPMDEDFSYF